VITVIGPEVVTVNVGRTYRDWGATAVDGEGLAINQKIEPSGLRIDTSKQGTHTVHYNVEEPRNCHAKEKTRVVIVERVPPPPVPPVIHLIDNVVCVELGSEYTDAHATADDREDGDITTDIKTTGLPVDTHRLGTYTVTFDVKDSDQQPADQRTRTVLVVEDGCPHNLRPVITLLGPSVIEVELGGEYTDPHATADDPEDGDITADIEPLNLVNTRKVNTRKLGTYIVTYDVEDSDEQSADQRTRTVRVIEAPPPPPPTTTTTSTTTTTPPVPRLPGELVIALTDNENERGSDDELVYTVRFANFGTESVAVTAKLELPPGLSGLDSSQCEGSVCTSPELTIHPIGEIVPPIDELPSWTVVVDVGDAAATAIVATVTVEVGGTTVDQDQEPTLLGNDQQ
jgi:hypothetical protein